MGWLTDRKQRSAVVWAGVLTLALAAPAGALAAHGDGEPVRLSIAANAIEGGKNDTEAQWIQNY
ncbi:MAG: hypothetical protein ACC726_17500, partial [Chloroflexota bacterium]